MLVSHFFGIHDFVKAIQLKKLDLGPAREFLKKSRSSIFPMATVALNLVIANLNKTITFKTPLDITVFDLCRHIQANIKNAGSGPGF